MPLTENEIADRGEHLAVNYSKKFEAPLYISPVNNPDRYQIHTETQLFYDNDKLLFLFSMPYKAGYHLLKINVSASEVTFSNFIVNKYKGGTPGNEYEMLPVATLCDSLLVIQNSDFNNLEYHFYNFYTNTAIQNYKTKTDSSFFNIVHSPLRQAGTDRDREKDISFNKIKNFLKKKNQGLLFLKAYKEHSDTLIIIFGSYIVADEEDPGVRGYSTLTTLLGFNSLTNFLGLPTLWWTPTIYSKRNNFLFATSAFDAKNLTPIKNAKLNTTIDRIVDDKKMDDLEKPSSFLFEMKEKIYMGIFNKKKNEYEVFIY